MKLFFFFGKMQKNTIFISPKVCCAPFVAPVVALEAFRPGQMRLDADRASLEASKSLGAVLGIFVSVGGIVATVDGQLEAINIRNLFISSRTLKGLF